MREAQRAARESGEALEIEYRFIAKDGRAVWLQDSYTVVRDETGAPGTRRATHSTSRRARGRGRPRELLSRRRCRTSGCSSSTG